MYLYDVHEPIVRMVEEVEGPETEGSAAGGETLAPVVQLEQPGHLVILLIYNYITELLHGTSSTG